MKSFNYNQADDSSHNEPSGIVIINMLLFHERESIIVLPRDMNLVEIQQVKDRIHAQIGNDMNEEVREYSEYGISGSMSLQMQIYGQNVALLEAGKEIRFSVFVERFSKGRCAYIRLPERLGSNEASELMKLVAEVAIRIQRKEINDREIYAALYR